MPRPDDHGRPDGRVRPGAADGLEQPLTLGQPAVSGTASQAAGSTGQRGSVSPERTLAQAGGNGRDDNAAERRQSGFGWDSGLVGARASAGQHRGQASAVVVPPAEHVAPENRLPIFEAVESDWFRRGRSGVPCRLPARGAVRRRWPGRWPADGSGGPADGAPAQLGVGTPWPVAPSRPGARVWRQLASGASRSAVRSQRSRGPPRQLTRAGRQQRLPARRPPGGTTTPGCQSAYRRPTSCRERRRRSRRAPVPARSAAATRDRFASFQRGVREGRAAASGDDGQL